MNNGTDLNTKIEELKQFALKSGNTFVVDMINSNKNRNDLFFENMSKMMNKGGDGDKDSFNGSENDDNDNERTLILKNDKKYNVFIKYMINKIKMIL